MFFKKFISFFLFIHYLIFFQSTQAINFPSDEEDKDNSRLLEVLSHTFHDPTTSSLDLSTTTGVVCWPRGLEILANAFKPQLTKLNLWGQKIKDQGIRILAPALHHSQMTRLILGNNLIGYKGVKILAKYAPPSLMDLDLENNELNDEGISALIPLLPQLVYLNLAWNNIGDLGIQRIAPIFLTYPSKLKQLLLPYNNIGNSGSIAFASILSACQLEHLDLSWNKVGVNGAKSLATNLPQSMLSLDVGCITLNLETLKILAEKLPQNLTHLSLLNSNLKDKGIEVLADWFATSQLEELNLRSNQMTCAGLTRLAENMPQKIKFLDLWNNKIECTGIFALSKALKKLPLRYLNLGNNNLCGAGEALAEIIYCTPIISLTLTQTQLQDDDVRGLASALEKSSLEQLFLEGCGIGAFALMDLGTVLQKSNLTHLDLSDNALDWTELEFVFKKLADSNLTSLFLNNNWLDNQGIIDLSKKLVGSRISSLSLENNRFNDDGAMELQKQLQKTCLVKLMLEENDLTSEIKEKFQQQLNLKDEKIDVYF